MSRRHFRVRIQVAPTVISRLQIDNFRCLRSVDVPLRPLTVLIGENDTGKSAFLDAIRFLVGDLGTILNSDYWQLDSNNEFRVQGTVPDGSVGRESPAAGGREAYQERITKYLVPTRYFRLPSGGIEMESDGFAEVDRQLDLGIKGERLAALLDYMTREDRARFKTVVDLMQDLVRGLDDIAIATPDPKRRRVDLIIENNLRIQASKASYGVQFVLFCVSLLYHPRPPKIVLLEEPENGVHPRRLGEIIAMLKSMTKGEHANPTQVILTTHSPYLLDHVDLDEDQVLVFRRNDDGSRDAEPVDADRLKVFLDEFKLGEVWFNEGEQGLLGAPA